MDIAKLREVAKECSSWNSLDTPLYSKWADSMDEAADEIEQLQAERSDLIRRIRECETRSLAFERRAMEAEERLATQAELRRAGVL